MARLTSLIALSEPALAGHGGRTEIVIRRTLKVARF